MSLETVSKALTEHLSVSSTDKLVTRVNDKLLARQMCSTLLWGIIAVVLGVAVLAVGKDYALVSLLGLLISLAGMLIAAYGVLSPLKKMALSSRQSPESKTLKQTEAELYLPPESFSAASVPSVTERTTELLEIENTRISK